MATTSENLILRLERLRIKTISTLLTRAEPLLNTASELVLSTLAWSETYLWYLEISLEELESRLANSEPQDTPHSNVMDCIFDEVDWDRLDFAGD